MGDHEHILSTLDEQKQRGTPWWRL